MGTAVGVILLVAGIVALSVLYWVLRIRRGKAFVRRWAAENGWELVAMRYCWDGGPFSLTGSLLFNLPVDVYEVTVRNSTTLAKTAHVRCGTWLGLGVTPFVLYEVRW
jgi:hypothetical protein